MYNRELQNIDTEHKAYLLGLFYSDGNIHLKTSNCRISLQARDLHTLEELMDVFKFFKLYNDSKQNQNILYCGYKEFKEDLINNGCHPQKSIINKELLDVPNIEDYLVRHFIRGYFDGNGGCTLSVSGGKVQKRVYIYSTSIKLTDKITKILKENNIKTTSSINDKVVKISISTLSYANFFNYLYKDSNICIARKKVKYDKILKTNFFIKGKSPICKFCNSEKTVFDGKPRILCRNCNKRFLMTAPDSSNAISGEDELLEH